MKKYNAIMARINAVAYFHRYGWIAVMMGCIAIWPEYMCWIFGLSDIIFAVWTYVGYRLKWRHIYCSFQDADHQEMTPYSSLRYPIKKSDAYGVPLIFLTLGFLMLFVGTMC